MLHDSVLMWALGVKKTIDDLGAAQLDNGTAITSGLINYEFQGIYKMLLKTNYGLDFLLVSPC